VTHTFIHGKRVLLAVLAMVFALSPIASLPATETAVSGRILDVNGGFAVGGAKLELQKNGKTVATSTTSSQGTFRFDDVAPGDYSILITAPGYQTTRAPDIIVTPGAGEVSFQTAIQRNIGPSTIATVVAKRAALQASTTINAHVPAARLQAQNYMRSGDLLTSVPGVVTSTSSSVGDDLSVSIRGFNSTETATLLNGHPIGPQGAFGSGFDYQNSPFWGLSGVNVIFGSGATSVYGASTIAGAVDFNTITPTDQPHFTLTQGLGNNEKNLTGVEATGTIGKFGYALAHGVEGTVGQFPGQVIWQSGNSGTDLTAATKAANTYYVIGTNTLRNSVANLQYAFGPRTNLSLTGYVATSWDQKSGNGDNDYLPYQTVYQRAAQGLANNNNQSTVTVHGATQTCTGSIAVLNDSAQGWGCVPLANYASYSQGPAGGGFGPWQAIHNEDYDARVTQAVGSTQLTLDGFVDAYGLHYDRTAAGGGSSDDYFTTHGALLGDAFTLGRNDVGLGYYLQHQLHTGYAYPAFDQFGNQLPNTSEIATKSFTLASSSYYVRDNYTLSDKLSLFGNFWFQHSQNTRRTEFDPRLTAVIRPTGRDVIRITGGRSYSEPDPALLFAPPSFNTTPTNVNPVCGAGPLNQIGSVSNPALIPETANDFELAAGHRFSPGIVLQADVYDANEQNALFNGNLPLSALGQTQIPAYLIQAYLNRIDSQCPGETATTANLSVSTTYNAASARYRGIQVGTSADLVRGLTLTADYDTQSAVYENLSDALLAANVNLINGSQIPQTPLHMGNVGLTFDGPTGFSASLLGHYMGVNNTWNRPAFWWADFNAGVTRNGVTINFGVNNLFNSAAQQYGYIGQGVFMGENQFGTDTSCLNAPNCEEFGLPYRQVWTTITFKT
jgi:outer membrane receptor protein involved in Fe transport